jgi:hypothetical protein
MVAFRRASDDNAAAEVLLRGTLVMLPHEIAFVTPFGVVTRVNAQWTHIGMSLGEDVKRLWQGDHALDIPRAAAGAGRRRFPSAI